MIFQRLANRIQLEKKVLSIKKEIKKKNYSQDKCILIFSDPRGGSTWLAETLASLPNSFIYWEPLALNVSEVKNLGFGWRQHIPYDAKWPEAKKLFDEILSISIINEWTTQKIENSKLVGNGELPIVKVCRGNHLLEWLVGQYNFKYKPIYLVRHPLAVIASQLKQGGWDYTFNGFQIPKMKFNDHYLQHEEFLSDIKTKEEALLATWCITNKNLLEKESDKWVKVYYEDLVLNPIEISEDIFFKLGLQQPRKLQHILAKWSSTTVEGDVYDPAKQLRKWTSNFSPVHLARFQEILDHFEVKTYSANEILPKKRLQNEPS